MKKLCVAVAAVLVSGTAWAQVPLFAAKCPTGITADSSPKGQWQAAVARDPGGTATVVVTLPDRRTRVIFFEKGKAIGADLSQADGNMEFSGSRGGDVYYIQAGDERYEIVEAFVFGG